MLPHLLRRIAAAVSGVLLAVLCVAAVAGGVRLLPWLASPTIPGAVIAVFARLLAIASLEVALVIAAPVGVALETWRITIDHTSRTLLCLGVRPARLAAHAALVAATFAIVTGGVSSAWSRYAQAPGDVSNRLLQGGRSACDASRVTTVPLVDVTWLCVDDQSRVVGVGNQGQVAWSAADVQFSDDLSGAVLQDLRIALRSPRAELTVHRAVVRGFAPWLAPGAGSGIPRAIAFGVVVMLASASACWSLLRWPTASRVVAFAVGVSGPAMFLLAADRILAAPPTLSFLVVVVLAAVSPLLVRQAAQKLRLSRVATGGS